LIAIKICSGHWKGGGQQEEQDGRLGEASKLSRHQRGCDAYVVQDVRSARHASGSRADFDASIGNIANLSLRSGATTITPSKNLVMNPKNVREWIQYFYEEVSR